MKCANCDSKIYWLNGRWRHCTAPNCGQPEPERYPTSQNEREIDRAIKKKELEK